MQVLRGSQLYVQVSILHSWLTSIFAIIDRVKDVVRLHRLLIVSICKPRVYFVNYRNTFVRYRFEFITINIYLSKKKLIISKLCKRFSKYMSLGLGKSFLPLRTCSFFLCRFCLFLKLSTGVLNKYWASPARFQPDFND